MIISKLSISIVKKWYNNGASLGRGKGGIFIAEELLDHEIGIWFA